MSAASSGIVLRIQRLRPEQDGDVPLPSAMSEHAAGMDVRAVVDAPLSIAPGAWAAVPTGLVVAVPPGYEVQIRPRSGLAVKHGVTVLNGPGTVDADYRGQVKVLLVNHGSSPFVVERGMRVAQLVVSALPAVTVEEVRRLDDTPRGSSGFGSTGAQ